MNALETRGLTRRFGGFCAVDSVDFTLAAGERRALIGPNGAGKTTFVNLLSGALPATAGSIALFGEPIGGLAPHQRARRGLARTYQTSQLFPELTPLEAMTLAVAERAGAGATWWRPLWGMAALGDEARRLLDQLHFPHADRDRPSAELAYGRRRLLEIALALALKPRVLLLDEPAAGVPPAESREVMRTIAALPRDVAVLLIEHDMDLVFRFAERITVMAVGAVLAEGTPEQIARDPRVREAYLGAPADA